MPKSQRVPLCAEASPHHGNIEGKVVGTYLPSWSPIVCDQLIILDRELVSFGILVPGGIDNHGTGGIGICRESRDVLRGKLDHGKTLLEIALCTLRPVDNDIELETLELGPVIDLHLDLGIGRDNESRDTANGIIVEFLVDEIQDLDLDILNL